MPVLVIVVGRFLQLLLLLKGGVQPLLENCLSFGAGVPDRVNIALGLALSADIQGGGGLAYARHGEDGRGAARVNHFLTTLFDRLKLSHGRGVH